MAEIYHIERHVWAWVLGGIFAALACLMTAYTVKETWRYNSIPTIRKHVIRILLMVPIYAIEAWLGLFSKEETLYWDMLRECYEAVVIWSFYSFLIAFLGGENSAHQLLSTKQAEAHHLMPFKWCLKPWSVTTPNTSTSTISQFVMKTKFGVLQYVPLRLATALAAFICQLNGVYENGTFHLHVAYPYLSLITNCSQVWAMYNLVLLYHAAAEYIEPIHPFMKFCCVKLVVFFTFWQSVLIAVLAALGSIGATDTYTTDDISAGIQDFLICIEMFVASIAHGYAFPPLEFHDPTVDAPALSRISTVFSPADVVDHVTDLGAHTVRAVTKPVRDAARKTASIASGGWGLLQNQRLLQRQNSQSLNSRPAKPADDDNKSDVPLASNDSLKPREGGNAAAEDGFGSVVAVDVQPGFELDRQKSSANDSGPATAEWRAV